MPTLQAILQRHFRDYAQTKRLSVAQQRAGHAIAACRTARLGGHVQRCPNGHVERVWYNSCHHRACPQCNGLVRERWIEKMRARLVGCAHHHAIFTIPHELNVLWMLNTPTRLAPAPTRLGGPETDVMLTHPSASTRIFSAHDDCSPEATTIEFP